VNVISPRQVDWTLPRIGPSNTLQLPEVNFNVSIQWGERLNAKKITQLKFRKVGCGSSRGAGDSRVR
jgi:hypothetical protein